MPSSMDDALLFINKKFQEFYSEEDARDESLPCYTLFVHLILPTSHLRPQGLAHSVPMHSYPHSQGDVALSNSVQHSQSQNATRRPLIPNHSGESRTLEPVGRQGALTEQKTDSAFRKANDSNSEAAAVQNGQSACQCELEQKIRFIEFGYKLLMLWTWID
ncbi:hypothetical protein TanjilG_31443 [Lupinus angustifolius]|uniref:Uncharacterized protein n=1 Tax=Lupinus angustifolius TaxID=3871 RepID=A0A4P1RUJ0_LUPAN|nr:hypothetical protein TanjilG_31443 [Lupinus angustifolius]